MDRLDARVPTISPYRPFRDTAATFGALAWSGFRRYTTYRQATIAGSFTNVVFGFLRCYVLLAVAAGAVGGRPGGYDAAQLTTFVWVGQGLLAVVALWGWTELADRIRSGEVTADLLRPVHPVISYLAPDLGRALHALIFRFLPPVVAGLVFFDLYLPGRWFTVPLFAISVLLAVVGSMGLRFLVNATAYWLHDARGPIILWTLSAGVLAGLYFPLRFLPDWLAVTLWVATPFPGFLQTPLDVLIERDPPPVQAGLVVLQACWAAALLVLCVKVQRRATSGGWWRRVAELRAYAALLGGLWRSLTAYRASFLVEMISNVGATALDVLAVLVIFRTTRTLAGFTLPEAVLMVSLSSCAFNLADFAVGNIEKLQTYVRTGMMDSVLVRPLGTLAQLVLMDLPLRKALRLVLAVSVLVVALRVNAIDWTPARVALAVVVPLAGAVFFGSIFVLSASLAFWWVDSGQVGNAFTYGGRDFTAYPVPVYSGWFRTVFAYGLGFGFVSYQPALALLGRADPLGLPGWAGGVSPLIALAAAGLAALVWRSGIRHYRSTGS